MPSSFLVVTSTTLAAEALKILRENKNDYHVVITDVKRLDMDGFKLLEIIGLEMDLPVIRKLITFTAPILISLFMPFLD